MPRRLRIDSRPTARRSNRNETRPDERHDDGRDSHEQRNSTAHRNESPERGTDECQSDKEGAVYDDSDSLGDCRGYEPLSSAQQVQECLHRPTNRSHDADGDYADLGVVVQAGGYVKQPECGDPGNGCDRAHGDTCDDVETERRRERLVAPSGVWRLGNRLDGRDLDTPLDEDEVGREGHEKPVGAQLSERETPR